ncbi:MAG: DUF2384 domain-containing protein [Opitutae bacterium]|nr:DUF2384 domain-containing protein [Opitutae bacterium]
MITLTPQQRRRLDAGLLAEIRRLERCRRHIARIDKEVFLAGISCFGSASDLALWLSEPAVGLGGKVPLHVMRTVKGREDVANLLRRIDYGVY